MPDGDPLFGISMRQQPANERAEMALLGALLYNNKAFDRVAEYLAPEHFSDPVNGVIYKAIARRVERGQLADAITLKTEFENGNALDEVGGTAYFAQLLSAMVGIINAGEYGRVIHDAWQRREIIAECSDAVNAAFGGAAGSSGDVLAGLMAQLERISASLADTSKATVFNDALDNAIAAAERAAKGGGPSGLSSGMPTVDEVTGGLLGGDVMVLAGRPGMGKSALGHQWAIAAARSGAGVLEISNEMSATALGMRALSAAAGVPLAALRRGRHGSYAERLVLARRELHDLPLLIEDGGGLSARQIAMKARAARRKFGVKGLGLIMVDHLHIVPPDEDDMKRGGPTWAVGKVSAAMKRLAKELGCPVLLLAQLSRAVEQREDKRPGLADLRQSGDIEQDADAVAFVYRPEYYLQKAPEKAPNEAQEKWVNRLTNWEADRDRLRGKAELIFEKVREGERGTVNLQFDSSTASFAEPQPEMDY